MSPCACVHPNSSLSIQTFWPGFFPQFTLTCYNTNCPLQRARVKGKAKVCIWAKWPVRLVHISGVYVAWGNLEYLYYCLDRMLVLSQGYNPAIILLAPILHTWVKRDTVSVKCLTMTPARAWTWTAQSRAERTNHEATRLPIAVGLVQM